MRYLFVSTYPPTHCGIASYADQAVTALRSEGNVVDVLSPDGRGNVDLAWNLRGGYKPLRLLALLPFYDRITLQYHCDFFYQDLLNDNHRWDSMRTTISFIVLYLLGRRKIEVVAHEVPCLATTRKLSPKAILYRLYRWKWKLVPHLVLHTVYEGERLARNYELNLRPEQVEIRPQQTLFRRRRDISRENARRELGVPLDVCMFLCIGFIQPHKGFDRAIRAFRNSAPRNAMLWVVGSLRVPSPENEAHLGYLRDLAAGSAEVHILDGFLADAEFDTWLLASDWVVLPYREIWSSGVFGRAKLLERPVIASKVGGMKEQGEAEDLFFEDDHGLELALRNAAGMMTI